MASPKEVQLSNDVQPGSGPSNSESGSIPQPQATSTHDMAPRVLANEIPPAHEVPLSQQHHNNESETLDPCLTELAHSNELGAEVLEEVQVTQNPLEAEVRCSWVGLREIYIHTHDW